MCELYAHQDGHGNEQYRDGILENNEYFAEYHFAAPAKCTAYHVNRLIAGSNESRSDTNDSANHNDREDIKCKSPSRQIQIYLDISPSIANIGNIHK